MARGPITLIAGVGLAAMLLTACSADDSGGGNNGDDSSGGTAEAMQAWDACEVLGGLQPLSEYMGVEEWAGTSDPASPTSSAYAQGWDAEGLVCFGGIDMGSYQDLPMTGQIRVSIVPKSDEGEAEKTFEGRIGAAADEGGEVELGRVDLTDPWDQGFVVASGENSGATEYLTAVGRDGQWLVHVYISYGADLALVGGGTEPFYRFDSASLQEFMATTYLPQINQSINDKIAEGA